MVSIQIDDTLVLWENNSSEREIEKLKFEENVIEKLKQLIHSFSMDAL